MRLWTHDTADLLLSSTLDSAVGALIHGLGQRRNSDTVLTMPWLFVLGFMLMVAGMPVLTWHDKHPLPEGRSGGAMGLIGNKLVYAGGTTWRNGVKTWLDSSPSYDFERDAWTDGQRLPEPLAYGAYLAGRDSLEIFGGANESGSSRKCWRLQAGERTWKQSGVLPADGVLAKAVSMHGRVYLFGGSANAADLKHLSNAVFRRDESGVWKQISEMPQGRVAMPAAVAVGDSIYLFGGCSASPSGGVLNRNEAYRFNSHTNEWAALHSLPAAIRGLSAVAVDNRYILVAGGYTESGFSSAVYLYDIQDGQYRPAAPLPLPVMGMQLLMRGQAIWGIGGEDKNRGRTARVLEGIVTDGK